MSGNEQRATSRGFFVTGTDTGVGKTLVACSLLRAAARQGLKVVGMKPVASGAVPRGDRLVHDDVERLIASIWRQAYSRDPVPAELAAARQFARGGRLSADGLEDLLWSVFLSPEYQFIR